MAHKRFAQINENNLVVNVITCDENETIENLSKLFSGSSFVEVSAGVSKGYTWQSDNNRFIAPQPYDNWTLNNETGEWEAPIAKPSSSIFVDSENNSIELKPWLLIWNDDLQRWECITANIDSRPYWNSSNSTWNIV
jgi:hypothetical protein